MDRRRSRPRPSDAPSADDRAPAGAGPARRRRRGARARRGVLGVWLAALLLLAPVVAASPDAAVAAQDTRDVPGGESVDVDLSPAQLVLVLGLTGGWVVAFAVVVTRSSRRTAAARAARARQPQG